MDSATLFVATFTLTVADQHASVPASPRLDALQAELQRGDTAAQERFWSTVEKQGTPLVESVAGDPGHCLVTFLSRSETDTKVVLLADFGDYVPRMTLARLTGTDIWYRSLRFPDDARFLYELAIDDGAYPFVDGDRVQFPSSPRSDPLNPHQWDQAKPQVLSLVELPNAPSMEFSTSHPDVPHGIVGRFEQTLHSDVLGNDRSVFVYRPAGYSDSAEPYPLLLFGASYISQIRLPVILDNLIAQGLIPPVVVVFINHPAGVQDEELGGGDAFGTFVATELLPWVRERVHVTTEPGRVVIGGASASGHSAACVALKHSEAIGNVIAQSGAFWRGIDHTAAYWRDPAHDEGREGFAHAVANRARVPVRYWITIGLLERGVAFSADVVSMVHASRHVRDVLLAKGYEVTLRETSGGHDPFDWESSMPEALIAILGSPPEKPR